MELVTPGIGLMFWMTLSFVILLLILKKFAWKPIMKMLQEREDSIASALTNAEKAREEMEVLKEENKEMIRQTKEQRLAMLEETEKMRAKMIEELKEESKKQADHLLQQAHERIENEKRLAFLELKKDMADVSVDIASKILREQLKSDRKATEFAQHLIDDMQLN